MIKEILKILPRLDSSDLNKMERTLTKRFGNVAKKFGKGVGASLLGGGVLGAAMGLLDKMLNPLKETQEAIDRSLQGADDVVTNAKQFNTTPGKMLKLVQLAESKGLDKEALYTMISKFQNTIAEAEADPKKSTSVRKFVGQTDTAEAFFGFAQALQKMERNQQLLAQQEVFGEKAVLKMASFLDTKFDEQVKLLKLRPSEQYTKDLTNMAGLNDLTNAKKAAMNAEDVLKKGALLNESIVKSRARRDQQELSRENARIASYHALALMQETSAKMLEVIEKGFMELAKTAANSTALVGFVNKFSASRLFRSMGGGE